MNEAAHEPPDRQLDHRILTLSGNEQLSQSNANCRSRRHANNMREHSLRLYIN